MATVLAGVISAASSAHAHHHDALPVTLNDASAMGPIFDPSGVGGSTVGLTNRFLKLQPGTADSGIPNVPITANTPTALLVSQVEFDWVVNPRFALRGAAPVVMTFPQDHGETATGAGDLRIGAWWSGRPNDAENPSRLHWRMGIDASAPTGNKARGFGVGAFLTRIAATAGHRWFNGRLGLALESGLSWAFREKTGLAIDYGVSTLWSVNHHLSLAMLVRAQTMIREASTAGLIFFDQQPRHPGDTMVILMPGFSIRAFDGLRLSAGPQIPLGKQTFAIGVAFNARYEI